MNHDVEISKQSYSFVVWSLYCCHISEMYTRRLSLAITGI